MSDEATRSARTETPTKQRWTRERVEDSWTLGPDEVVMLAGKRGPTRLGFAVMLRFFASEGRFPEPTEEPGREAVAHVARQVGPVLGSVSYAAN